MEMRTLLLLLAATTLFSAPAIAQNGTVAPSTRAAIDAGNQAWIDGVKTGKVALIMATYTEDAVDCGPTGECIKGRPQIEQHMRAELASFGRAQSATVSTWGTSQQGNFVYEWGKAEAKFDSGKSLVDKYLTVWQKQPDGSWKIFRNMVIPDK